jgi:ferredoxin
LTFSPSRAENGFLRRLDRGTDIKRKVLQMTRSPSFRTITLFLLLVAFVAGTSLISSRLWGGRPEKLPERKQLVIREGMSVEEFGRTNGLTNPALKDLFGLQTPSDLRKSLSQYGSPERVLSMVIKKQALAAEHATKNWVKIPVKFGLWFLFLGTVYASLRTRRVHSRLRKWLYFVSLCVFGVIMGSDPGPMGTVKDAIHLFGSTGAVFPPRMIALTVFLLLVFLANKYICAWGCQAGTLQDLVYRLNRSEGERAVIGRQLRPPFILTNGVRILFLAGFAAAAFAWGSDLIDPIDPFKVYKPAHLGIAGGIFIGALLLAGLFIYRPWCQFFCPFGLVGWLVEKISRVRVSVDYSTCIACGKCAAACPTTVMGAILKRDRTIPDCFSCYSCREVCPTHSIQFSARRRTLPPPDHFERKTVRTEAG